MSWEKRQKFMGVSLLFAIFVSTTGAMIPLWGDYVQKLGGNVQNTGYMVGFFYILTAFLTLVFSYWEQKNEKRSYLFIFLGLIIFIGGWGFFLWIEDLSQLYTGVGIIALGSAVLRPVLDEHYRSMSHKKWKLFSSGFRFFLEMMSLGCGAFIGSQIIHHFTYQLFFIGCLVIDMMALLVALFLFWEHLPLNGTRGNASY